MTKKMAFTKKELDALFAGAAATGMAVSLKKGDHEITITPTHEKEGTEHDAADEWEKPVGR